MKIWWCVFLFSGWPSSGFPEDRIDQLVDRYHCMNCHGLVHRQVGPGFAQVAGRYRQDTQAPAVLAGRIRNGGVGQWGRLVMPRQPQMSEAESLQLARWVLARPAP